MQTLMIIFPLIYAADLISPEPFGTVLGSNKQVVGYSNDSPSPTDKTDNYYNGIYTGLKYECVEYSRRWLLITQNLTFESVNCASDIWHLENITNLSTGQPTKLMRIPNGSVCPPKAGDILIYQKNSENIVGHVAVITEVSHFFVKISEQNWNNAYWPGDYSRKLVLKKYGSRFFLNDFGNPILGWMVYNREIVSECVDYNCKTCTKPDPSGLCIYL